MYFCVQTHKQLVKSNCFLVFMNMCSIDIVYPGMTGMLE